RSASSGVATRAAAGLAPTGRLLMPPRPVAPLLVPELPPGTPTLPVIAASAYAARWNCSPWTVRPGAYPQWSAAGFVVPNSIASLRMVSAGTPVHAHAHSGVLLIPSASPIRYERYEAPRGAPGGR